MRREILALVLAAFPGACRAAEAAPPPSIVRIRLPAEGDERQPIAVPTEPENTVEIDFPWPVDDWAGRGFTPDTDKFAGDFVIGATRGRSRIFVTPVAADAHRVLDVVLAPPGGPSRGVPIEFLPAPTGLAWRKLVIEDAAQAVSPRPSVSLLRRPPAARLRDPSAESELGLIRTMRLMLNTTDEGARDIAAANPALELAVFEGGPRSFGDFTLRARFAIRDSGTGAIGLCTLVANATARRLLFDPSSWVARVGDRVYPIRTVDFAGELEPGATGAAFLVLARGPDGAPTDLLADNEFKLSVLLAGSVNLHPVVRMPIEGFDPR